MNGGIIGTIIYFWAFIIGVIIFGKIFGYMNDTKTAIMVLIAAAIVFIVWTVGRKMAARRREEKEWEDEQARLAQKKGKKRR